MNEPITISDKAEKCANDEIEAHYRFASSKLDYRNPITLRGHYTQLLLNEQKAEFEKESTILRALVVKHECPYGHRNKDGVCNLGYPGCACADDAFCFEDAHGRHLVDKVKHLRSQLLEAELREKKYREALIAMKVAFQKDKVTMASTACCMVAFNAERLTDEALSQPTTGQSDLMREIILTLAYYKGTAEQNGIHDSQAAKLLSTLQPKRD